ncbi:MAG: hypothetical protein EOM25_13720 [Deltaproteobacteria bacterium]|nr:hypothetical protein [Deltaproteobacteria bacterium]
MRTTLDVEEDVLAAAKELARIQNESVGRVLSRLARQALAGTQGSPPSMEPEKPSVTGFRPFPARDHLVGNDQVDALRDQEGV